MVNETYTDFGVSCLIQTFVNKIKTKLWNECRGIPPLPGISNFQKEHFKFYEWKWVVRIEAVVFTLLTKVTWCNYHCRKTSGFTLPTTSGFGTPLAIKPIDG